MARIILWDTESTDLVADFGGMVCMGWKVLGEPRPHILTIRHSPHFSDRPWDDKHLVKESLKILGSADMWVTWYGMRHDVPFVRTRSLLYNFGDLPPVAHVDGWRVAKYRLKLHSNRLASVQAFLSLPTHKTSITPEIWRRANAGHIPSIRYIEDHCYKDVDVLEEAYDRLRPYIADHPNVGMMDDRPDSCPTCGAEGTLTRRGTYTARMRKVFRFKCDGLLGCGAWVLGKSNIAFLSPPAINAGQPNSVRGNRRP